VWYVTNLLVCEFLVLCVCAASKYSRLLMSIRLFVILIVSLCAFLRVSSSSILLLFYVSCNTRSTCVNVCNKPDSSSIDLFELLDVVLGVRVLYSRTVLYCWTHKCIISYAFDVRCTVV